jgi:hypothetical protein
MVAGWLAGWLAGWQEREREEAGGVLVLVPGSR